MLCRGNNRENETCCLWQRSTLQKPVFDLSETYIFHGVCPTTKCTYPKKADIFMC